jgi:BolA protein
MDSSKTRQKSLEKKIQEALAPSELTIVNQSGDHGRPLEAETHFQVVIISSKFDGLTRVRREQWVQSLLAEERQQGLHALSLVCWTPEEQKAKRHLTTEVPACLGRNHEDE